MMRKVLFGLWVFTFLMVGGGCSVERYWVNHPDEAYQYRYYRWALDGFRKKWEKGRIDELERAEIISRAVSASLKIRSYEDLFYWASQGTIHFPDIPDYHRYKIQALVALGRYGEARSEAEKYLSREDADPGEIADLLRIIRNHEKCKDRKYPDVSVMPVSELNTRYPDYSVSVAGNLLFFASQRPSSGELLIYGTDGFPYSDIFVFNREERTIQPFPYNSPYHEGTPFSYFRGDTMILLYSYCGPDTAELTTGAHIKVEEGSPPPVFRCRIMESRFVGGRWTEPQPFYPRKKRAESVSFPFFIDSSGVLYFTAGGTPSTIQKVTFFAGEWMEPRLASPFSSGLFEAGSIFWFSEDFVAFAGELPDGSGNLDIYFGWKDPSTGKWIIENGGCKLNSGADDYAPVITGVTPTKGGYFQVSGYFTSSRRRESSDDIYMFTITTPLRFFVDISVMAEDTPVLLPAAIIITDVATGDTLLDTAVEKKDYPLRIEIEKGQKIFILAASRGYMRNFAYVVGEPTDTLFRLVAVREVTLRLRPIIIGKEFIVQNIYYEFDDWRLLPESYAVLDTLAEILRQNPELVVEIGSHTDCRGSDYYNYVLSFKRAQSVVRYLVSKGVDPSRLRARGYGETMPVYRCEPCEACSEDEHAANRRTTFRIIEVHEREPG